MPPDDNEEIIILDAPDDATDGGAAPVLVSDAPADGIAEIQRQLDEALAGRQRDQAALSQAENGRVAAERRAQEAAGQAQQAVAAVQGAEYDSIVNAIAVSDSGIAELKRSYAAAMSEGDFDKVADLQVQLGEATARSIQLKDGKTELERRRAETPAAPAAAAAVPQAVQDQREVFLAKQSPRVGAWMRANPKYFDDAKYRNKVTAAHFAAIADEIPVESDEYFRFIEKQAGGAPTAATPASTAAAVVERGGDAEAARAAAVPTQQQQHRQPTQQAAAAPATLTQGRVASAAPSREAVTPSTARGQGTQVALTRQEREHAMALALPDDPNPLQTYARNKLAAQRDGRVF